MTSFDAAVPMQTEIPDPGRSGWGTWDALFVILVAFVIYIAGSIVIGGVDFAIEGKNLGFWVQPASYLCFTAGTVFMVHWWLIRKRGASWRDIGFRLPRPAQVVGVAGASLICVFVGTAIITEVIDNLGTGFRIKGNAKELLLPGQAHISVAQFITLLVLAAVLAPLTEETLFRGALFQGLRRDFSNRFGRTLSIAVGAFISGSLFGLFHLIGGSSELYTVPILVYLGVVLALAFQWSDSLFGSILVHASINSLAVVNLFLHGR